MKKYHATKERYRAKSKVKWTWNSRLIKNISFQQNFLLYSWRFSCYSAPIYWLFHVHMTCNNETLNAMSKQHVENYVAKRETGHSYPRIVDRFCTWSGCAVEGDLLLSRESQRVFQNLLLFCNRFEIFALSLRTSQSNNYSTVYSTDKNASAHCSAISIDQLVACWTQYTLSI